MKCNQVICNQSKLGEASTFLFETEVKEWLTVWRVNAYIFYVEPASHMELIQILHM